MATVARSLSVNALRTQCDGPLLTPRDAGFVEACGGWNVVWTQRPAVVVVAASATDVTHAVRFATDHGLAVAVQNTGHGIAVPADDCSLLLSTRMLDSVTIDPHTATATVGGGATWGSVLDAAHPHGLAPLMGSAPHVGIVGYSLGGGIGWLTRRHGFAVDAIVSLTVVLADGTVTTTTPTHEPELFWAMCGTAGGNLGVVVEMTTALVPVASVYAGNLFYPLDLAREAFARYVAWSDSAPLGLTSAFAIASFPPVDAVPEPMRGHTFVIVRGCFDGDLDEGAQLVNSWRSWRTPLIDTWDAMPFSRAAEISMDPVDPVPAASSGRWLSGLDDSVLDAMLEATRADSGPSPMLFAETRHVAGVGNSPNPAVSYSARTGDRVLQLVGLIASPGADSEIECRFESTWDRLAHCLAPLSGYLNFTEGHERVQSAQHCFDPATAQRLLAAKRRYDPLNVFRHGVPLDGGTAP